MDDVGIFSAIIVNSTDDDSADEIAVDDLTNSEGLPKVTLRSAIELANETAGADIIAFDIPTGPNESGHNNGIFTITPDSALPTIIDTVTIAGETQSEFTSSPIIEVNGENAGTNVDGLVLDSGSRESTISSLAITNFSDDGILIRTNSNHIKGNYIGVDTTGKTAAGNGGNGIEISGGGSLNAIGTNGDGTGDSGEKNIISGNGQHGVKIQKAHGNIVAGNYIGTDAIGVTPIANGGSGVFIGDESFHNLIGTDGNGVSDNLERNVISGNRVDGVEIFESHKNRIAGNYIGTDLTGMAPIANDGSGVSISSKSMWNKIGTNGDGSAGEATENNLISGNGEYGVEINGSFENTIAGNYIGTNISLTKALGNELSGVFIGSKSTGNIIGLNDNDAGSDGKEDVFEWNTISGNKEHGIEISDSSENTVSGNLIGIDLFDGKPLGNEKSGVFIGSKSTKNIIGTDGDGARDSTEKNTISGNKEHGIEISNSSDNTVAGNRIGTDAHDSKTIGNGLSGIFIGSKSTKNHIGLDDDDAGNDGVQDVFEWNIISGNKEHGIEISDSSENTIAGNRIGTDFFGVDALGNGKSGVFIGSKSTENLIGTDGDDNGDLNEKNIISGNKEHGIEISDSSQNTIAGNLIGTNLTGTKVLGNEKSGVFISSGSSLNSIGISSDYIYHIGASGEGNLISGNKEHGIEISAGASNTISGNLIGTNKSGTGALGNELSGVFIGSNSEETVIGISGHHNPTEDIDEGNLISGNKKHGIEINNSSFINISGNLIGTQLDGKTKLGNLHNGVRITNYSTDNRIGMGGNTAASSDKSESNTIAFNGSGMTNTLKGHGVVVESGTGNSIRGNSIFENTGRGIDLWGEVFLPLQQLSLPLDDGFTINDRTASDPDPDKGANTLIDYPVVVGVEFSSSKNKITWQLDTAPGNYVIDFYANEKLDHSGFGGGKKYLKSLDVIVGSTGRVNFTVEFDVADKKISATTTDSSGNTSEFSMIDTDGDALADAWELYGLDVNEDGIIDLTLTGANPLHKDLFVEIDAMTEVDSDGNGVPDAGKDLNFSGAVESFGPSQTSITDVVNAFAAAPYNAENTSGNGGTTFVPSEDANNNGVLDHGEDTDNDGILDRGDDRNRNGKFDWAKNPDWATAPHLGKGINLHVLADNFSIPAKDWSGGATHWSGFDAMKKDEFGTYWERNVLVPSFPFPIIVPNPNWVNIKKARELTHRYGIFGFAHNAVMHSSGTKYTNNTGSSGRGEIGGNDFMVTMGPWRSSFGGTKRDREGTFMHELGHTLGLRHGGNVDTGYKPNYHSVMNYTWQRPLPANSQNSYGPWALSYSSEILSPLDETALSEANGIGGKTNTTVRLWQQVTLNSGKKVRRRHSEVNEIGPISFDGNGQNTHTVALDINGDGNQTTLTGHDDWSNIQFYWLEDIGGGHLDGDHECAAEKLFKDVDHLERTYTFSSTADRQRNNETETPLKAVNLVHKEKYKEIMEVQTLGATSLLSSSQWTLPKSNTTPSLPESSYRLSQSTTETKGVPALPVLRSEQNDESWTDSLKQSVDISDNIINKKIESNFQDNVLHELFTEFDLLADLTLLK